MAILSGLTMFSQGVCTQFSYYYADITYPNGGEQTDLYSVQLDGENAILSPIGSLEVGVHIAFNTENGLLYAINDNTGEISIVDPITGDLISTTEVSLNVGKVTTAAFNAENVLFLGSENGRIYVVDDLASDPIEVSVYSEGNNISGGDLTFSEAGVLYLASKPQGKFYEVNLPFFANEQLGNVNSQVTGMATLEDGEGVIVSSNGNDQFLTYTVNGGFAESAAYNAILNDEPFTLGNGDMTSGCSERSTSIDGCDDYRTYYVHNAQGTGTDILYAVDFNDMGGSVLTELAVIANNSHVGVGSNGFVYLVEGSTGILRTFNPFTLGVENEVQINEDGNNLSGIPAVVVGDDGFVYIGQSSNNSIYKVDPMSGDAEFFGSGNVSGGDLVFVGDALWLANRAQGRFYEINGEGQFDVDAEEINGVSVLPDGNLLIANGNFNGLFEVYEPITGDATGETFETGLALWNGDLAGRCFDGNPEFQGCEDFQTYYIHTPLGGGDVILYSVELTDLGEANLTALRTLDGDSHLGLGQDGLLYIVRVNTGVMTILDIDTDTEAQVQINLDGTNITGIPAVVAGDDGFIYVGSGNTIYKVEPSTGDAEVFGNENISGGDLVFAGGALWYANRSNSTFYEVNGEGQFTVGAAEINGVSVLPNGNLLIADGDLGSTFEVYEPLTGNATGQEFDSGLELYWGDLAGRCFDNNNQEGECENFQLFLAANGNEGGDIYRVSLEEGTVSLELLLENLGRPHIAYDDSNGLMYIILGPTGEVAVYDPVADILTTFSNITMGEMDITETYSAVVRNDGTLLVGSNFGVVYEVDPITGEASNPIDAAVDGGDIIQTNDGDVWVINRGQGRFYNLTDGVTEFDVELDGIYGAAVMQSGMILVGDQGNQLRVVDPAVPGLTETVYELDFSLTAGDLAGGCGDNYVGLEQPPTADNTAIVIGEGATAFVAYPNPTEGISNVQIVAGSSERAVIEVFDMSGRSVATLLNQDVQEGNTYRMTFDGTQLPNGVYVVKYVTQSETAIEKIMIAR